MPRCTRKGCGKEYDQDQNTEGACSFHPGVPVFHEGLKSWSCCQDTNKPVLDFDSFMLLPGCTRGVHTSEKPLAPAPTPAAASTDQLPVKMSKTDDGKEVYSSTAVLTPGPTPAVSAPSTPVPVEEDEDDLSAPVAPGTTCKRLGCGKSFISDEESRTGDGENATCVYHPLSPIFREGSKGYFCCKRRVLEFDEFLKITGCKTGKHVFVKKSKPSDKPSSDEFIKCRIDHYQTPTQVHVSVFAKQVDKTKSTVKFEDDKLHLDLYLPGSKRFLRTVTLYGPIDSSSSTIQIYGTKVEVILAKQDGRSWNMLEKPPNDIALPEGFNITFGVTGRTGTVGGKELVLDEDNKLKTS